MRAICIGFVDKPDGALASIRMEPSWHERLFGVRPTLIELQRVRLHSDDRDKIGPWMRIGSGRRLDDLPEREMIRNALDFREVEGLPTCKVIP